MREFLIEENLRKRLEKLSKKDKILYDSAMKKVMEILSCPDLSRYKNLRNPLQKYKRVHIKSSFVLVFRPEKEKVVFYSLEHHDDAYRSKAGQH